MFFTIPVTSHQDESTRRPATPVACKCRCPTQCRSATAHAPEASAAAEAEDFGGVVAAVAAVAAVGAVGAGRQWQGDGGHGERLTRQRLARALGAPGG